MKAALIAIGNEILIGQVTDTNSAWSAEQLRAAGIEVTNIFAVSDTRASIFEVLSALEGRVQLVIMTGGLGPTSDDITRRVLAEFFDSALVYNEAVEQDILAFLARRGRADLSEANRTQAFVLKDGAVLRNPIGTAPGMWIERGGTVFVSLPGVPFEMKELMTRTVIPTLRARFVLPVIHQRTVLTHGIAESDLAEQIAPWERMLPNDISLAYLPSPGLVRLRLTVTGDEAAVLRARIDREVDRLEELIGDAVFGYDDDTLEDVVGKMLDAKQASLALAESCTGGAIAARITARPGASTFFKGGVVAYSNEVKAAVLQVPQTVLDNCGAVSRETVEAMATHVRRLLGADYAAAVSGVAGPTGGTPDKPLGLVWIAVASEKKVVSKRFLFGERRDTNIARTVMSALNMLRILLIEDGAETPKRSS